MKFSKSEKILIVILLVLVIFFGGGALLVYPQFMKLTAKSIEFVTKTQQKIDVSNKLARLSSLDGELKSAYEKSLAASKRFYTQMSPTDMERIVTGFILPNNAALNSVSIGATEISSLDTYVYTYAGVEYPVFGQPAAPAAAVPAETPAAQAIAKTSVTVSFSCAYPDLKNILNAIYAQNMSLYISNFKVDDLSSGLVKCDMAVDIYAISKIAEPAYAD